MMHYLLGTKSDHKKDKDNGYDTAYEIWRQQHQCCPICKSTNIAQTLLGPVWKHGTPYEDNLNTARCGNCSWTGAVNKLVPCSH